MGGFFLVRLLIDPVMVRRPLLEPNLSASGLTFTGLSLLVFLMANVITNQPEDANRQDRSQERLESSCPSRNRRNGRIPAMLSFTALRASRTRR